MLNIFLPILTIAIMVFFFMADGVVWGVDTWGYLNMDISREAGYPLFLRMFSCVFGEKVFAQAVAAFQFILLGTAILLLTDSVAKLWKLSTCSVIVVWGIQIFFLLLLKFGSGLGAVYTSTLLTEGITYPVYFLYFKAVLQLEREYSRRRLFELLLYCSILTFIRTQLAVTYMAVIAFWLIQVMVRRFPLKKWMNMVFGCLLGAALVMGGQKLYTYALYGVTDGTVGSSSFFMTSGLYNAQEEDEQLFETEEDRQAFRDLYNLAMQRQTNYKFAEARGFFPLANHYADNFDVIKFEVVGPYFYQNVSVIQGKDGAQLQIEIDKWNKKIGFPLFMKHLKGKMMIFFQECIRGYMRTIAKCSPVFLLPALIIYIIYLCSMVYCFRLNKKEAQEAGWGALFVLIISTGNIMLTAFMIFCEPRYVLYNMVPFYISGYLLILEVYRKRRNEDDDSCTLSDYME